MRYLLFFLLSLQGMAAASASDVLAAMARADFSQAIAISRDATEPEVVILRAHSLFHLDRFAEARTAAESIPLDSPLRRMARYLIAQSYAAEEQVTQATEVSAGYERPHVTRARSLVGPFGQRATGVDS